MSNMIISQSVALEVFSNAQPSLEKRLKTGVRESFSMPILKSFRGKVEGESSTAYNKRMGAEYAVFKPLWDKYAQSKANSLIERFGIHSIKYTLTRDGREEATIKVQEPKIVDRVKAIDARIAKLQAEREQAMQEKATINVG